MKLSEQRWLSGALGTEMAVVLEARGKADLCGQLNIACMPELYAAMCDGTKVPEKMSDRVLKASKMTDAWDDKVRDIKAEEDLC